ncbi:protein phosphatase [Longimycelium tulufanense]|uniref:Serine/threonine protein phosphatase PstP n=1 Tax=Longimycelium tulufanense TaxID=907463 RepID=A0A8J3CDM4_9PSEU|nr:PP2C family serine/threonine-protein phosphatase [Longimycelium tulufanense]GGM78116.1 protein phosphatase [Longimycelium tulufanense]
MTLVLRYAARSDRGLVRSNNQDSVYAGPRLLALADGMGGHAAGEVASKVVIAALAPLDDDEPGEDLLGQLREATLAGNAAIAELVSSDPDLEGMGTTLTAVLFAGNKIGMVHVGDSRAYLLREGTLSQITHDDTFVQSLIDEGRITAEEAATHPQRSLLLRALTGHEVEPSLTVREARAGDRYLLCSDGLSGVVSAETLAEALGISDPQEAADRLIELALKGGGPDNVTVIVADVVDVDFGEDAPIVGGAAGEGDDPPPPDSPASRAAMTTPRPQQPPRTEPMLQPPEDPPRRRGLRTVLTSLVVLGLLAGAFFAGRYWVLQQYYVGATEDGRVVIFQGVRGSFLGIPLHRQREGSCAAGVPNCEEIAVKDLEPAARDSVRSGITSSKGLEGARETVRRVRMRLLPLCPTGTQPSNTSPGEPGQPSPAGPPPTTPAEPAGQSPSPAHPSESSGPEATPLPSTSLKPDVECRTVR